MEDLPISDRTFASTWEIKNSSIHGKGLFARRAFSSGEVILEYVGQRVPISTIHDTCGADLYMLAVDDHFAIDGDNRNNPARFANHSCDANSYFEARLDRIFIVADRVIDPGTEITVDYGFGLEGLFHRKCNCGASSCIGYIISEPYRPAATRLLNRLNVGSERVC